MYFCERHEKIMEILKERGSVTVQFLAKELFVSLPTIRRDLAYLESKNCLRRTFGGAVPFSMTEDELPFEVRDNAYLASKKQMAEKAKAYVQDDMVLFLDASSTCLRLVPHLAEFKHITVITNGPIVSLSLAEKNIRSFCTGGLLLGKSKAYAGSFAEDFIKNFNADIFFFCCRGLSDEGILTDSSIDESNIRRVMMANAKQNIFLCGSEKFGKKYMYNVATLNDVDVLISDADTKDKFGI